LASSLKIIRAKEGKSGKILNRHFHATSMKMSGTLHMAEKEAKLQLLQMIWNGISGLGPGTVILKALFIIFLGAVFWMFCELVKYVVNVFSKLAVEALRYLAIAVRGWPKAEEKDDEGRQGTGWDTTSKRSRK